MNTENSLSRKNFWIIAINSVAAFIISYIVVFYLNHFSIIFTAGMFDHDVSFDFSKITYHVNATDWTHDSVKVIFGSGPLIVFITGLLSLLAFSALSEETTRIKLILLWLSINAFNFVFSGIIIGIIFKIRIAHLFIWLYFNDSQLLMMALLCFFGILMTALLMSKRIAFSANSYFNKLDENNFPFFIMAQIIVPFIIGALVLFLFFLPQIQITETYIGIGIALIIMICTFLISGFDTIYFDEDIKFINFYWPIIIISVVLLIAFRLALNNEILMNWTV